MIPKCLETLLITLIMKIIELPDTRIEKMSGNFVNFEKIAEEPLKLQKWIEKMTS